jgi:hypothetical protein
MSTAAHSEDRLAQALRRLIPLALDGPDWVTQSAADERHRACIEARIALDVYDRRQPAVLTPLRANHALRLKPLALASTS